MNANQARINRMKVARPETAMQCFERLTKDPGIKHENLIGRDVKKTVTERLQAIRHVINHQTPYISIIPNFED